MNIKYRNFIIFLFMMLWNCCQVAYSQQVQGVVTDSLTNEPLPYISIYYQGKGVGRKIIQTLEQDEFYLRAKRIEIPASITACEFYKKMGYNYKNGIDSVDDEQLYRMEKFR